MQSRTVDLAKFNDSMFQGALHIVKVLSKHGEAYIVGGAVRDILMGKVSHDVDISTNVSMDKIEALFQTHDIGKNKDFGIVVVNYNGINYEIANFRSDGSYSDGRRPDTVQLGVSFEDDTKRRDFTINAMGLDLNGRVIDFHGGIDDLNNKVLRTVGKAEDRFREDYLRIIRAVRFTVRFGYSLDKEVFHAIFKLNRGLLKISIERVRDEILKIISSGSKAFRDALLLMDQTRVLDTLFPGLVLETDMCNSFERLNSKDEVSNLALFFSYHKGDVLTACQKLKIMTADSKKIAFVLSNLDVFEKMFHSVDSLSIKDKLDVLSLINSDLLSSVSGVYNAIYNRTIYNFDKKVKEFAKYNVILDKKKDINQFLLNKKVSGRMFGVLQNSIVHWLFVQFDMNGILSNNDEINAHIDGILNV